MYIFVTYQSPLSLGTFMRHNSIIRVSTESKQSDTAAIEQG